MNQPQIPPLVEASPSDCLFQTILDFLLPFFLAGARGDADLASAAIFELLDAYNAATMQELDLAGRIIIFSTTAMDNLRLSMADPAMSDTKKLRYRSNAVALSRSAEQCRKILDAMQAQRPIVPKRNGAVPSTVTQAAVVQSPATTPKADPARPVVEPAVVPVTSPARPNSPAVQSKSDLPGISRGPVRDADIETMKQDARLMIEALHRDGASLSAIVDPSIAGSFAAAQLAAHSARSAAGQQRTDATATEIRR